MLTIKGSDHILGAKNIKGHHSSQSSTGLSVKSIDARRVNQEGILLINKLMRRAWLSGKWEEHQGRCKEKKNED